MPSRLKDSLKSFLHLGTKDGLEKTPQAQYDILDGGWPDFEDWIRRAIGGNFRWGARPRDSRENRQMVADSIAESTSKNDGTFPQRNAFIERQE